MWRPFSSRMYRTTVLRFYLLLNTRTNTNSRMYIHICCFICCCLQSSFNMLFYIFSFFLSCRSHWKLAHSATEKYAVLNALFNFCSKINNICLPFNYNYFIIFSFRNFFCFKFLFICTFCLCVCVCVLHASSSSTSMHTQFKNIHNFCLF